MTYTVPNVPPRPQRRKTDHEYFASWSEKVIGTGLIALSIAVAILFWVCLDVLNQANQNEEETLINRQTGYQNRGVACSNLRQHITPEQYAAYSPCQDPLIQAFILR